MKMFAILLTITVMPLILMSSAPSNILLDNSEMDTTSASATCAGCATTNCTFIGSAPCQFFGGQYVKKEAVNVVVAYCKNGLTGGCKFSNPVLCYTIFTCGSDSTCTDCSTSPQYVPATCVPL